MSLICGVVLSEWPGKCGPSDLKNQSTSGTCFNNYRSLILKEPPHSTHAVFSLCVLWGYSLNMKGFIVIETGSSCFLVLGLWRLTFPRTFWKNHHTGKRLNCSKIISHPSSKWCKNNFAQSRWQVTRDMWHASPVTCSYSLGVIMFWRLGGKVSLTWVNQWDTNVFVEHPQLHRVF